MPHIELGQNLRVCARNLAGIVGAEHLLVKQGTAGGASGNQKVCSLGQTVLCAPAHAEGTVFQESNEAAPEAEEVRGAQCKLLQEFIQLADGAEVGRDVQQLVQFVSLGAGRVVKLGIGNGHCPKTGDHGNQRLLLRAEDAFLTRIYQDCSLGDGGAEGRGNQHTGGNQITQGVGGRIDGHADGFVRRYRPACQIGGELQSPAIMPSPHRSGQLRRLGSDGAQAEGSALPQQHADQAGT